MSKGKVWPVECQDREDHVSGVRMRQLTDYMGHSHHLYFTNPGWYDDSRRLLFGSDRDNRTNFFSIELESGEITQLTDLKPPPKPLTFRMDKEFGVLYAAINPARAEACFWYGRELMALDLHSLELRTLWERPEGFNSSILNCTADGKYVCGNMVEDVLAGFNVHFGAGYSGFTETCEAHPLCRVFRVALDGSGMDVVHEDKTWMSHVNTSPTQANILSFCHEGPWHMVDHRIWMLDMETGKTWKIRPREVEGEGIGHEYWHADGVTIGYHGRRPDGGKFFGKVRYDGTEGTEVPFPHETGHIHSNDFSLIVGDGGCIVRLWKWNGTDFDGPKMLCYHRSSMHIQKVHVHPRFSPDGSYVIATSDTTGYGNIYQVRLPEFETLPDTEEWMDQR